VALHQNTLLPVEHASVLLLCHPCTAPVLLLYCWYCFRSIDSPLYCCCTAPVSPLYCCCTAAVQSLDSSEDPLLLELRAQGVVQPVQWCNGTLMDADASRVNVTLVSKRMDRRHPELLFRCPAAFQEAPRWLDIPY
jgi:hypothetical protein